MTIFNSKSNSCYKCTRLASICRSVKQELPKIFKTNFRLRIAKNSNRRKYH